MVDCELEDLPPRNSEYQFRFKFGGNEDRRQFRARIVTFVNAIFPRDNVTFKAESIRHSQPEGVTLVKLGLEWHRRTRSGYSTEVSKSELRTLCWAIVRPENRARVCSFCSQSLIGISPVNTVTSYYWREAVFQTALRFGQPYLEGIQAMIARSAYIPQWAFCLAFATVAGVNLAGYQVTPPAPWKQDAGIPIRDRVGVLFGAPGRETGEAILRDICNRLSHDLPEVGREEILIVQQYFQTILDSLSKYLHYLPGDDSPLSSQALRRLRGRDYKALLAAYDATLLFAKSLLNHVPAFDAYISMRNSDVDSDLELTVSAIGSAIGIATSFTTVATPWYSWATISSLITGAGWPTMISVSHPLSLGFGGAMMIVTLIRKSQRENAEALVTPERQFLSVLSYSCSVVNEASLFTSEDRLPANSTTEDVSTHLNTVGVRSIRKRWHSFLKTQNDEVRGTVRVARYLRLRLLAERDALTQHLEIANEAVNSSDEASEDASSRSNDSDLDSD